MEEKEELDAGKVRRKKTWEERERIESGSRDNNKDGIGTMEEEGCKRIRKKMKNRKKKKKLENRRGKKLIKEQVGERRKRGGDR